MQFNLAVDRGYKDKTSGEKQTDFISCTAWRETATNLAKYQSKGSQILIEGQIQTSNYTDNSGVKHYKTEVVCERIEFLGSKKEDGQAYQNQGQTYLNPSVGQLQPNQYQQSQYQRPQSQMPQQQNPFEQQPDFGVNHDDLPF